MITNHKEIGLGHLLASWLQDDVFTLPSWQAEALMELHQGRLQVTLWWVYTVFTGFCSRILESKANLLSKSSVTRQGASMAWLVTSRPFTYREPSITARSSGASFDLYVQIYVFLYHQVDTLSQMKRDTSCLLVPTVFELIWCHQRTFPSATLKSLRFSKNRYETVHMILGQHIYVCM